MKIHLTIDVKFRAFGFTFGQMHQEVDLPLPKELAIAGTLLSSSTTPKTLVDDRGVKLVASFIMGA